MSAVRLTANEARAIAHHLAARAIDAETGTYPIRPEDAPNVDEASWNAIDICLGRLANSLRLGGVGYVDGNQLDFDALLKRAGVQ